MGKHCFNCHRPLEDDALFCPGCGSKYQSNQSWHCTACGQENSPDAQFCKKCGSSLASQMTAATTTLTMKMDHLSAGNATVKPILKPIEKFKDFLRTYPYAKIVIGAFIVCLLSIVGSYLYFNFTSESTYIAGYSETSRKITDANEILTSNITPDKLKSNPLNIIQQQLQQQKDELDNLQKRFESKKGPEKYAEQHKYMTDLLKVEATIFQQTDLILANPLNAETDNLLTAIKSNIDDAKALAGKIQMPDATVNFSSQMLVLPNQLTIYVEEKRKASKEKMDRLAAMNEFFKNMDAITQKYNNAKTDLGGMLENLRKGGYTWFDYFNALRQAKYFRTSLRTQVNNLAAPKGAEGIKQQLGDVLTQSINYCDLMNAAANVENNTNYFNAQPRYKAAQAVNDNVQSSYSAFTDNYQAEKARLTNIDNL